MMLNQKTLESHTERMLLNVSHLWFYNVLIYYFKERKTFIGTFIEFFHTFKGGAKA